MVNKIVSNFASQITHFRSYLNSRINLASIVALGALGTMVYFLQKPSSSKPTPTTTSAPTMPLVKLKIPSPKSEAKPDVVPLVELKIPSPKSEANPVVKKTSTSQPSTYCLALRRSNNILDRMIGAFLPTQVSTKKIDPTKVENLRHIRDSMRFREIISQSRK